MRTNIDIDDELMSQARSVTGLKTKKDIVEKALAVLIRLEQQKGILALGGQIDWTGDLEESREGRHWPSSSSTQVCGSII